MGLDGLRSAITRGGTLIDSYPADLSNYIDGNIKGHWVSHKALGCTITDADEVSQFVCQLIYPQGISNLNSRE
jgi:hypothetical protein